MPDTDSYSRRLRCEVCRLTPGLCVCDSLPRVELPIRLLLIRHSEETYSQSNTGRLVHRVFPNSELVSHASPEGPLDAARLWRSQGRCRVLFPSPEAEVLNPGSFGPPRGPGDAGLDTLVVLDAKWRQARRMSRRIEGIRRFPFVTLPADRLPVWTMRRGTKPGQFSTAEAVGIALECLGFDDAAAAVADALSQVVPRVLHLRGKLRRQELRSRVPGTDTQSRTGT